MVSRERIMIRHIPSRYGRGITIPSAASVSLLQWGYTPLLWAAKREADPDLGPVPVPIIEEIVEPAKKRIARRPYVSRTAEPWEARRAAYLARRAG